MSETLHIRVSSGDDTIINYTVEVSEGPPWTLILSGISGGLRQYEARDLFEAMIALRKELEKSRRQLLCAGARFDVFPSGMSRSMSGGRKAYKHRLGITPEKTDLVDIFEYAELESVSSVEQQVEFHKKWIASIDERTPATEPKPGEIDEAKRHPGGWVYRIGGTFRPDEYVPPEKIIGGWKVDSQGNIVGKFIKNMKYRHDG